MIQRYLGTTVYGMKCKYVDTKSLPYNTLSRYHIKKRRTYGLTLSPYHIKKTTDQGDAPDFSYRRDFQIFLFDGSRNLKFFPAFFCQKYGKIQNDPKK
jgi:hypothetical protein